MADDQRLDSQIQFARHVFENQQALIRTLDSKSSAMMSLLAFLGFSGFVMVRGGVDRISLSSPLRVGLTLLFFFSAGGFILGTLGTLVRVLAVLRPRFNGVEHRKFRKGEDLIFSSHIRMYTAEEFDVSIRAANDQLILSNLTRENYSLAQVAASKSSALSLITWPLLLSFTAWAIVAFASIALLSLAPLGL